jgi:hypothetical protein
MKEVPGLINAKSPRPPNPKPSPKEFVWPSQRDGDEGVAKKIAASLQELLTQRGWRHIELAKALWGTHGEADAPRNTQAPRRWVLAEIPIPSERDAGYIAEVLGVSMARLLEPEGKFDPLPAMIRPRSDSKRFHPELKKEKVVRAKRGRKGGRTASGKDREKQRAYNLAYRERQRTKREQKRLKQEAREQANHAREAVQPKTRANGEWHLAAGVKAPQYTISSDKSPAGHVNFTLNAILPHERAMAILHMLQHSEATDE